MRYQLSRNDKTKDVKSKETKTTPTDYPTRRPKQKEMIFGLRAVIEAIDAGKSLDKVLLRRDMSSALAKELYAKLKDIPVAIQKVPVEKLNSYTDKNHQGVIAFLSPIDFEQIDTLLPTLYEAGKVPFFMVLDGITDMRNFGAIARTAVCAGVDALIISTHKSVAINGDAVKTSAGALLTLPVCKVENLKETLSFLKASGVNIIASTEHTDKPYTSTDFNLPTAIVMGSEDIGIQDDILNLATEKVRIPMKGKLESLNVSVAAAIMMYEVVRQRSDI